MSDVAVEGAGFFLKATHAWGFLGVYFAVVLVHGIWRSRGAAPQDPIRTSGPIE